MTKPIKPSEVPDKKTEPIPEQLFEAFNTLIAKHWDGTESTFTQKEVIACILQKLPNVPGTNLKLNTGLIYSNKWLDVETSYRLAGWTVTYDKPGYNETYDATFTFKKKRG